MNHRREQSKLLKVPSVIIKFPCNATLTGVEKRTENIKNFIRAPRNDDILKLLLVFHGQKIIG